MDRSVGGLGFHLLFRCSAVLGQLIAALAGYPKGTRRARSTCAITPWTLLLILNVARAPWMIIYANRGIAKDLGRERAELLGAIPGLLTPRPLRTRLSKAVREGSSLNTGLIARRKDGSTFSVGIFLTPVRSSAGPMGCQDDMLKSGGPEGWMTARLRSRGALPGAPPRSRDQSTPARHPRS
jgi:PAS domain-containing protein